MMTVTKGLGQGKLDQAVAGTERKDEIGAMAGSLEVLRGQLSEAEALRRAQAEREAREREILNRRNTLAENFVARMTELSSPLPPPPIRWPAPPATSPPPPSRPPAKPRRSRKPPKRPPSMCRRSPLRRKNSRPRCGITGQVSHTRPRWRIVAYTEAETSNARISELATAATAIGDVISLIKGIADQTTCWRQCTPSNPPAGPGKGFAVVASEVKQLASQTARATDEISAKISEIQQSTQGTVTSMAEIMRVIANMKQISSSIAGAVEETGRSHRRDRPELPAGGQRHAAGDAEHHRRRPGGRTHGLCVHRTAGALGGSLGAGRRSEAVVERFVEDLNAAA